MNGLTNMVAVMAASLAGYELFIDRLQSGLALLVLVLSAIWLAVQIWSKIMLTNHEVSK